MSKYEIYGDTVGQWRWRLKSSNGRIVASGEGYTRRQYAYRGVRAHRKAAATLLVVEKKH